MGLPALSSATAELLVVDLVPQHDPEPDTELASGRDFGLAEPLLGQLAAIETLQFLVLAHGMTDGFTPQEAQQRVALLGERAASLSPAAGVLTGNHADIAGDRLAIQESRCVAEKDLCRQRGDRADTRMAYQQPCLRTLLGAGSDRLIQFIDLVL